MLSLTRFHPTDPLLRPRDLDWEINGILNPGATLYNGQILLLYRAIGDDHVSRFGVAVSADGMTFTFAGDQPAFSPNPESRYEERGVEDPRITFLEGQYGVVYVAASINKSDLRPRAIDWKTRVSLAWTSDFQTFTRRGVIIHSYNDKNAALFPSRWGEHYYLYHRRHPSIWLSRSLDLNTWEDVCNETCIVVEPGSRSWDNDRVGIGSQPLATDDGWLVFYHGRDKMGVYRFGAFLADLANPQQVIAKLPYPLLEPALPFEVAGPIPNVIFTCGAVDVGDSFMVYYGGADYAIGGAYVGKRELLEELKRYPTEGATQPATSAATSSSREAGP